MSAVQDYIDALEGERKEAIEQLRAVILENLPDGFEEAMSYGMIGYVVPHSKYPAGYHCDPKLPLPFLSIASQKSHIGFYHMGVYVDQELLEWFQKRYAEEVPTKLDMGKSCVRFKNTKHIPYGLLGELVSKMSAERWIELYEENVKR
jgi:uncharacterized protein YdhG (YjbR/CyaY superfamily)